MTKVILFFCFISIFQHLNAGCPRTPVLAICEVNTVQGDSYEGIIVLYGGGYNLWHANGIYFSEDKELGISFGFGIHFNLNLHLIFWEDNFWYFVYSKSIYQNDFSNFNDTVEQYSKMGDVFFIEFETDPWLFSGYNFILENEDKKQILLSNSLENRFFNISDSLIIYKELDVSSDGCHRIIPSKISQLKIPLTQVKSIRLIRNPDNEWLNKIVEIEKTQHFGTTYWWHNIVSTKKKFNEINKLINKL